jgi:thioesterase domain-containing protein/acyl carrier protein
MEVARAMAEILGVSAVSIHDDFFTLGGNSILALRLVARLQSLFGRELPLARFYDGPTVAEIARCVDAAGSLVESAVPIVRLSTAEHGLRLFCPHAIGADVFSYVELARLVEPTLAIHGIRATRVGDHENPRSVEEMASAYLQAIREIQPAGPYYLAGWSFGGLIAYELAQQLTAVGEEVALLAIIDGRGYVAECISHTLHLLAVLGDLLSAQVQEKLRSVPESNQIQYVLEECAARGIPRLRTDLIRIYAANHHAATKYHPQPYAGSALFVRAINEILPPNADPILYWQRLIRGSLAVHRLPCRHNEILEPPHVSAVGSILLEAVAKTCDHAAPLMP